MPRITRISGSLAIVLIAYWAYALLAVPRIEPPADPLRLGQTADGGKQSGVPDLLKLQMQQIRPLFGPNDWEVTSDSTKVLESERAKLLFQKYTNEGSGKVVIEPCTIVLLYEGPAESEAQRLRQSIILQAPSATLQFDRALDLTRPKAANLEGGQLNGRVVIRSDWKQPGPEDDLWIVTRNIRLDQQTISTAEPVEFRWGPHFGNGHDMEIKLLQGGSGAAGLNFAGIESFELRHVERLHLDLGQATEPEKSAGPVSQNGPTNLRSAPDASHKAALSPFSALENTSGSTPVEINCRGPFRFDAIHRVATFRDTVRVVKLNPVGDADQIACDLLSLWFIERPKENANTPAAKAAKTSGSLDLAAERLEAKGNPVVVTAPSSNVTAHAQRIEYNLLSKSITLDGEQPVFLQRGPNEICARSLYYQSAAEEGRLGQLISQGPGRLHGQSPDRPDRQLEAVWQDRLQIQPRQQYQEISLTGGAELNSPGMGRLQAKKIFLWLLEKPPDATSKEFTLHAHGLSANDDVHIGSSRLSGKVDQLEVWFEEVAGAEGSAMRNQGIAAASTRGAEAIGGSSSLGSAEGTAVRQSPQPTASSQPMALLPPASPQGAQRHFEVTGRLLQARVLIGTSEPALSDLTIEDGVRLVETQTADPAEQPVLIRGNQLKAVKAYRPDAVATIVGKPGQPAHFEGRGLGLTGSAIVLDNGTNHLSIDGSGQMDMTITNDLEGHPLPTPSKLAIYWQRRMDFDGRTARFEQSVVASTPGVVSQTEVTQFCLKTNAMDVQLQRPICFSDPKTQEKPQIEEIRCREGVAMESRSFDAQQQLVSHDQMQVTDLVINLNQLSGAMQGGPGWLNTVRYGSDDAVGDQPAAAAANAPAKADQLHCLHVKFQKQITGNFWRRQVNFSDQVRATFAPVENWDAMLTTDDPSQLGPKGEVARCDELSVVQMLFPVGGRRVIELCASGNAIVEGAEFKALGNRITYAQAKELLTIEGNGPIAAELLQQKTAGAPVSGLRAQTIRYSLKTKAVSVGGGQMLEVPLPSGSEKKKP